MREEKRKEKKNKNKGAGGWESEGTVAGQELRLNGGERNGRGRRGSDPVVKKIQNQGEAAVFGYFLGFFVV